MLIWYLGTTRQILEHSFKHFFSFHCFKGVCPHMKAPLNGERLTNNFAHGARLTLKCNQGYTIDGPSILFCNKNGTWSSEPPVCKGTLNSIFAFA